jgi:exosortase A-associated hydrolase 2
VHPFAEEMNKSRRMAALQARRLADAGWAVLQMDLLGCGDSAGDLEDARTDAWEADLDAAAGWLCERHGVELVLWGLRLGASLGLAWMARSGYRDRIARAMLWQPVRSGARHLDQFLRVAVAGERTAGGGTSSTMTVSALRQRLEAGETLEIGGYRVSAALARGLDALQLDALHAPAVPVHWLEIAAQSGAGMSGDAVDLAARWRSCGTKVDMQCTQGDPFWATAEIVQCEPLLSASTRTLTTC